MGKITHRQAASCGVYWMVKVAVTTPWRRRGEPSKVLYGWIGAPFVEKCKGLGLKHMWLSGDQIWKVQGLFLMAVVIGVLIALCSCGQWKPKRSVWKYLELAVSLLIVELPYISVGIADLLYPIEFRGGLHLIYNHLPEAVMLRIGFARPMF